MKTETYIIIILMLISCMLYLNNKEIKIIQKQQITLHQQDSIKWVQINNRLNK